MDTLWRLETKCGEENKIKQDDSANEKHANGVVVPHWTQLRVNERMKAYSTWAKGEKFVECQCWLLRKRFYYSTLLLFIISIILFESPLTRCTALCSHCVASLFNCEQCFKNDQRYGQRWWTDEGWTDEWMKFSSCECLTQVLNDGQVDDEPGGEFITQPFPWMNCDWSFHFHCGIWSGRVFKMVRKVNAKRVKWLHQGYSKQNQIVKKKNVNFYLHWRRII